jgi:Asp-tRNA(Asn)/Glu-tRNA(Gln) amidotransferase C subunit
MTHLTVDQLEKLQNLSNIKLNDKEQDSFLSKLDPILAKLEELGMVDISLSSTKTDSDDITLRLLDTTFEGQKQQNIAKNIIKNIEHEVINNSIVIKSVLS